MKGKLELILAFMIAAFLMALLALLMQTFDLENPNRATIISGMLSMVGGGIGALGAYLVANNQMEKQFKKQDADRVLELRVNKLNETLLLLNDVYNTLDKKRVSVLEIDLLLLRAYARAEIIPSQEAKDISKFIADLREKSIQIEQYKNDLRPYDIFCGDTIDFKELQLKINLYLHESDIFREAFKYVYSINLKNSGDLINHKISNYLNMTEEFRDHILFAKKETEDKIRTLLNIE